MSQIPTTPVAYIGTYARGYAHKDFDTASIAWEFDNLEGLRMHQDASYLYLQFLHNSHAPNVQFFLDTDNDPDTGNLEEGGADYMVENGYLYRSTDPRKWKWQEIGPAESTIEDGKSDTIRIKLTDLQNKTAVFRADAQALDADWVPQVLSPHDGTMSVRVISVTGGKFDSPVETKNYLIGEQTALPVVALAIDNRYLYDDTIGIYTVGTNGKKAKDCGDEFGGKANFMQKWERAAHMTLFERDKKSGPFAGYRAQSSGRVLVYLCAKVVSAQKRRQIRLEKVRLQSLP